MKVKFITNACAIYSWNGFRLLSDPWLTEPIMYGTWYHNPPIKTSPMDVLDVDALYISHIHPDHCDEETLKHFRRDIEIYTLEDKYSFCMNHLLKLGFTQVHGIKDREACADGFHMTMFGPFAKHPLHECQIGNVVDSAMLMQTDKVKVLNTNDNMPSIEAAHMLKKEYGPFDLVQLNYNPAGPYPACFVNYSDVEKQFKAEEMSMKLLTQMVDVAKILDARYTMPFAGSYKLGGESEYFNRFLGVKTARQAADFLTANGVNSLCLEEGEEVDLGS